MKSKLTGISLLAVVFCLAACIAVMAAEPGDIWGCYTGEREITLYLADPGEGASIDCQIGTSKAEEVGFHPVSEEKVSVETVFLIDNSLSIKKKYRPLIPQYICEIAANRMPGEVFTLASFSDHTETIIEKTGDYTAVKQAAEGISFNNQDAYLSDVLYQIVKGYADEKEPGFRRIVIFSDGMDENVAGITREEIYTLLQNSPVPVYTIGCTGKDNQEQLKDMFALSRITGVQSWLFDEIKDPMTVVEGIAQTNNTQKVTVLPKESDCDGSRKGLILSVTAGGNTIEKSIEVNMPFILIEETETETETVKETETERETAEPQVIYIETEKEIDLKKILIIAAIGFAAAAAIAAAVILLIRASKKKREANKFRAAPEPEPPSGMTPVRRGDENHTMCIRENEQNDDDNAHTQLLWEERSSRKLLLEDVNNPMRFFEVSLNSPVTIGYDSDCTVSIQDESTVSRKHCRIYENGGHYYVQNLSQTNITKMNGIKVPATAELFSGSSITLGRLTLKVEIR